jgi:hypothetical protein
MNIELHVNKGATDIHEAGETYIPVYSEGEIIGNVTLTQITKLSDYLNLLHDLWLNHTKEVLKQNGIPDTYQDYE